MNERIEYLGKVGVIVADWDIRNDYPYKTITTDYSNWTTYISRKPVPVGTPITNTTYWKPICRIDPGIVQAFSDFKQESREQFDTFRQNLIQELEEFKDEIRVDYNTIVDSIYNMLKAYLDEKIDGFTLANESKIDSLFT